MTKPKISITAVQGLATATLGDQVIAASEDALRLTEGGHDPVLYFPADNCLAGAHLPVKKRTRCPWKGEAAYFDLGGEAAAWTYYDPIEEVAKIAAHRAYYPDKVTLTVAHVPSPLAEAQGILDFWFDLSMEAQFTQSDALDRQIAEKFGALYEEATVGALDQWAASPKGALALIILLDQFSRNLHRGEAAAFDNDPAARDIATRMIEQGFDLALSPEQRSFVYLPFMHSEALEDQNLCVTLFASRLPGAANMSYALSHRQDIHRHGRFPYRDEALGREGKGSR